MRELATKEAVWATAAALDVAGTLPTVVLIREQIGGSFTTIQKHLRSWHAAQVESQAVDVPSEIDDQVTVLATQLARDLWRAATLHNAAEIAQIRQQARAEVSQAEAERDGAYGEISRLEGEAEAEGVRTAAIIERLEREATERTAQLAEAQRESQALATERARASELERQLAGLRGELEGARAQGAAQITEAVAAIQQQLIQQAATLQRLAGRGDG